MAKVLMLERSTWSRSTGKFPENFLGSFGGFEDWYKAHLGINLGQKSLLLQLAGWVFLPKWALYQSPKPPDGPKKFSGKFPVEWNQVERSSINTLAVGIFLM